MLFTLLICSFVIVNNAVQLSLHPIFNRSKGNFMTQILANTNNTKHDQSLIDMFAKLDPAQIETVVTLVQGLLSTSQADLDKITSASTNADEAYVAAVNAHNAATVAQTEGGAVAKSTLEKGITASQKARDTGITALENTHAKNVEDLQATHDGIVASLKAAFDSTLQAKEEASAAKLKANTILSQEKGRLDKEISSLSNVIALLHGVKGPRYTSVPKQYCNGHPGGILRTGFPTKESCEAACSADVSCTGFDYAPGGFLWCVLVTDSNTCNLRSHGNWNHYQKIV